MSTFIESPRVAFVSGASLPASSPFSLSRLILPLLCISLGVSVGTATGLTLALVNARNNAMTASSDSVQTDSASAAPQANVAMNVSPAPVIRPAVVAPLAAIPIKPATNPSPALSKAPETSKPAESHRYLPRLAAMAKAPFKIEVALIKTPDALRPATFKLGGKEYHAARLMSLTATKPAQPEPAAAPLAAQTALNTPAPAALNAAQLSLDTPRQANIYTEGDLTVAEYDATAGTLETSDGKTFALGTTVAAANATSWETYRSDVHYRCDQHGSCVLMRAGVVAPNARLI